MVFPICFKSETSAYSKGRESRSRKNLAAFGNRTLGFLNISNAVKKLYYGGSCLTFFILKKTDAASQCGNRDSRIVIRIKLITRESIGCQDKFGIKSFVKKETLCEAGKKAVIPLLMMIIIIIIKMFVRGYVFVILKKPWYFLLNFRMFR